MVYGIKYLKIQQEIMKNVDKAKYYSYNIQKWMLVDYDRQPDTIGVSDGRFIMFIPKDYFYLNENVFGRSAFNGNTVIKYNSPDDGYPVVDSGELIKTVANSKKSMMLHKFRINEKQENIYIDDGILTKYFDLSEPVQLRATGKKEPLYIWDQDTLVGLILPVNHPEGGEES